MPKQNVQTPIIFLCPCITTTHQTPTTTACTQPNPPGSIGRVRCVFPVHRSPHTSARLIRCALHRLSFVFTSVYLELRPALRAVGAVATASAPQRAKHQAVFPLLQANAFISTERVPPALVCTICSPRPLAGAAEPQVDRVCVCVCVCVRVRVCARVRTRRKVVLAKAAPPGLRSAHLDEVHTQRSRAHLGCVCHQRRPLCVRSLMCARRSVQQQRGGCSGLSAVQSPPRLVSILVYNINRPTPFAAHRLRGRALLALCARCLMPQNM